MAANLNEIKIQMRMVFKNGYLIGRKYLNITLKTIVRMLKMEFGKICWIVSVGKGIHGPWYNQISVILRFHESLKGMNV